MRDQRDQFVSDLKPEEFEVFEDGVSRALRLDYGQFALKGELTALELLPAGDCQR